MCGRYTLTKPDAIQTRFSTENIIADLRANYNVAPFQTMPIVVADDMKNKLELMRWTLVPSWSKEEKLKYTTINARAEDVESKATYRGPFKTKRCIIPADGFYEWKTIGKTKTPHYFTLKNHELFGFAGLWDSWKKPDGSDLHTFTIITTEANVLMEPVHNRMPVILKPEDEDDWLNPDQHDPDFLKRYLKPYSATEMTEHIVSDKVGNYKNNYIELIEVAPQINSK